MIRHLLHHTYRSQWGWLWMLWALSALQAILGVLGPTSQVVAVTRTMVFIAQCFLAVFALAGGIQAHAVEGDTVFWHTRPITREQVLKANFIFVAICVLLPFVCSVAAGWLRAGFTGPQLGGVAFQWLVFLLTGTALVCAAAVHTQNIGKFFVAVAGIIVTFIVSGAAVAVLSEKFGWFRRGGRTDYNEMSSLLVAVLLVFTGAMLAWFIRSLGRNPRCSWPPMLIAILAFAPIVTARAFSFLQPHYPDGGATKVAVVTDKYAETDGAPDTQLIWTHFRVTNLPTNTIAVPEYLGGEFANEEGKVFPSHHENVSRRGPLELITSSPVRGELMQVLRRNYPATTIWSGENWGQNQATIGVSRNSSNAQRPTRPGTFRGHLRTALIAINRIGDFPLKDGYARLGRGRGVGIEFRTSADGQLQFWIHELSPSLMFTRRESDRRLYWRHENLYVLYNPITGEAIILDESGSRSGTPTFLNNQRLASLNYRIPRSLLRERLTGGSDNTWLNSLRLHVYQAEKVAQLGYRFEEADYNFRYTRVKPNNSYQAQSQVGVDAMLKLKWPGKDDPAAAQKFAHDFIRFAPNGFYGKQLTQVTKKLTDIGPEVVPFLLREAPYTYSVGRVMLRNAFNRIAKKEHLPELLKALERDPGLAYLLRAKRWEKEGAPVIAGQVKDRTRVMGADSLTVLAAHAKPEHYADLAWHAERCESGQEYLFRNLRDLPGFPYAETVRAAWHRARLDFISGRSLAVFAAEQGELDALHDLVRQITASKSESRDRRAFEILQDSLDTTGDTAALKRWLIANIRNLRFDAEKKKYVKAT